MSYLIHVMSIGSPNRGVPFRGLGPSVWQKGSLRSAVASEGAVSAPLHARTQVAARAVASVELSKAHAVPRKGLEARRSLFKILEVTGRSSSHSPKDPLLTAPSVSAICLQAVLCGKADMAGEQASASARPAVQYAQQQWLNMADLATLELPGRRGR